MVLLAADTSGKHGSVALARGDFNNFELIEMIPLAGGTFSAQLVSQIAELLADNDLSKHDIDGFVVVSGPGSFTGLRVGLAAIKGLAEILKQPVAAVSLLEAVAMTGGKDTKVIAALDAGRGQAYAGEYEVIHETATCLSERLLSREEFVALARSQPGTQVASPDRLTLQWCSSAGVRTVEIERPTSAIVARIGLRRLLAGQTVSPEELEANYIRRSDAEIFSRP
jgi:tRNA threonylcarbamoyladenosine biosynthesis protein TsaB